MVRDRVSALLTVADARTAVRPGTVMSVWLLGVHRSICVVYCRHVASVSRCRSVWRADDVVHYTAACRRRLLPQPRSIGYSCRPLSSAMQWEYWQSTVGLSEPPRDLCLLLFHRATDIHRMLNTVNNETSAAFCWQRVSANADDIRALNYSSCEVEKFLTSASLSGGWLKLIPGAISLLACYTRNIFRYVDSVLTCWQSPACTGIYWIQQSTVCQQFVHRT